MVFRPCSENKACFLSLSRFFQQRDCTITGSCTEENVDAIVNTDLEEHLLSPSGQAVVLKDYPAHRELRRSKVSTSTSGMPAPMEAHQSGEMVFQLKIIFWAHFTDVYIQSQNCISHPKSSSCRHIQGSISLFCNSDCWYHLTVLLMSTVQCATAWCQREARLREGWQKGERMYSIEAWKAAASAGQEEVIPMIHPYFPLPIMSAASLASHRGCEDSLVNVCKALYRWRELCKC